jgi:hypothetical protein
MSTVIYIPWITLNVMEEIVVKHMIRLNMYNNQCPVKIVMYRNDKLIITRQRKPVRVNGANKDT